MPQMLKIIAFLITPFLCISCGNSPSSSSSSSSVSSPRNSSRAVTAQKILNHPKITLLKYQVSGRNDGASAYHSIKSTAQGNWAKRSSYQGAPGGYVKLDNKMLSCMLYLADKKGYSFRVTSIAGGSHSRRSRHYVGTAFDVDRINGRRVNYSNPYFRKFLSICRKLGATEAMGPGKRGHSTHVHVAWPRP